MAKQTGPKRTRKQKEADFARLADMYVKGWTQAAIGEVLGINQSVVSVDLKELHRRWREHTTLTLDDYKLKELAKLDKLEQEYWAAWERSQAARKTKRQRKSDAPTGVAELQEMIQVDSSGDARYLDGVLRCIDRRSKLLGLDAPAKSEVAMTANPLADKTDEELAEIMRPFVERVNGQTAGGSESASADVSEAGGGDGGDAGEQ